MFSHRRVIAFFIFSFFSLVYAQVDPSIDWREMQSKNYLIIYDANQQKLAEHYLQEAERAYQLNFPLFDEAPERTIMILNDFTDLSNGTASVFPRATMQVYPALPDNDSVLNYYDDWAKLLLVHEYAHILNLNPTHGLATPLRWIFGSWIKPNMLLPSWYTEGLAVTLESHLTNFGRLRSPYYAAQTRALVMADRWGDEGFAQIGDRSTPIWPLGQRPYYFGAYLWDHLYRKKKGPSLIRDLNFSYAQRIPFLLDNPLEEKTGNEWYYWLRKSYREQEKFARKELSRIDDLNRKIGEAKPERENLIAKGWTFHPTKKQALYIQSRASSDERLMWVRYRDEADILNTIEEKKVLSSGTSIRKAVWSPDGKSCYIDRTREVDRYNLYFGIYKYDFASKKAIDLYPGQRIKEPAVSPSEKYLSFVKTENGKHSLWIRKLKSGKSRKVYQGKLQERIGEQIFLNEKEILFTLKRTTGIEELIQVNWKSRRDTRLLQKFNDFSDLYVRADALYFLSEKNGTRNLYRSSPIGSPPVGLTNTKTFLISAIPVPNNKSLMVSELKESGYQLKQIETVEYERLPQIKLYNKERIEKKSPPGEIKRSSFLKFDAPESESYNSFEYLYPRYWFLFLSPIIDGVLYSGSTTVSDPLQKQVITGEASYFTGNQKLSSAIGYQNNMTSVRFFASYAKRFDYIFGDRSTVENDNVLLQTEFFLPFASSEWSWYLQAVSRETTLENGVEQNRRGPGIGLRYTNLEGKRGFAVSQKGTAFDLSYVEYLRDEDFLNYSEIFLRAQHHIYSFLPENHVFHMSANVLNAPNTDRSIRIGTVSGGGLQSFTFLSAGFPVRGYPVGEFLAWSAAQTTLEYRFPLHYTFKGLGKENHFPAFVRNGNIALFLDSITLDGGYFFEGTGPLLRTEWGKFYHGAGLEYRLDTTLVNFLPVQLRLGLFYGFSDEAAGGPSFFLGFGL